MSSIEILLRRIKSSVNEAGIMEPPWLALACWLDHFLMCNYDYALDVKNLVITIPAADTKYAANTLSSVGLIGIPNN